MTAATCGRKMSKGFDILTMFASPGFGYPAPWRAAVAFGANSAAVVKGTSVLLTRTLAGCPAGPASVEYLTEDFARKSRARSQELLNTRVPTGLNRAPQSAGSAMTATLTCSIAFSSVGLA